MHQRKFHRNQRHRLAYHLHYLAELAALLDVEPSDLAAFMYCLRQHNHKGGPQVLTSGPRNCTTSGVHAP